MVLTTQGSSDVVPEGGRDGGTEGRSQGAHGANGPYDILLLIQEEGPVVGVG